MRCVFALDSRADWCFRQGQKTLVPCSKCGRTLAPHRLEAHRKICKSTAAADDNENTEQVEHPNSIPSKTKNDILIRGKRLQDRSFFFPCPSFSSLLRNFNQSFPCPSGCRNIRSFLMRNQSQCPNLMKRTLFQVWVRFFCPIFSFQSKKTFFSRC